MTYWLATPFHRGILGPNRVYLGIPHRLGNPCRRVHVRVDLGSPVRLGNPYHLGKL